MNRSLLALLALPAIALTAPVPKAVDNSRLLVTTSDGSITMMAPDGSEAKVLMKGDQDEYAYKAWLSPDHKRFAYFSRERPDDRTGGTLFGVKTIDGLQVMQVRMPCPDAVFWSADGKSLIGTTQEVPVPKKGNDLGYRSWRMDAASGVQTALDLPGDCVLVAPLPGSNKVACLQLRVTDNGQWGKLKREKVEAELVTTDPDKFAPTTVLEGVWSLSPVAVFPDGKRWLRYSSGEVAIHTAGEKEAKKWKRDPYVSVIALHPGGKRVAYAYFDWDGQAKATRWHLRTADPDGTNVVIVLSRDDDKDITHIDWR